MNNARCLVSGVRDAGSRMEFNGHVDRCRDIIIKKYSAISSLIEESNIYHRRYDAPKFTTTLLQIDLYFKGVIS